MLLNEEMVPLPEKVKKIAGIPMLRWPAGHNVRFQDGRNVRVSTTRLFYAYGSFDEAPATGRYF